MRTVRLLSFLGALTMTSVAFAAENFPERMITIVSNSAAGGPTDIVARAIQEPMSEFLGQQIVVENRVGATGITGAQSVIRSPADGYTLLVTGAAPMIIAPKTMTNFPYDPLADLAPISLVVETDVFVVANSSVARTLDELVAKAKASPGALSFGTAGIAGPSHLTMEYFKILAGVDMVHVPYSGAPQAIADVLSGEVAVYASTLGPVLPHAETGRLTILAVIGKERSPRAPEIPSTAELGFPDWAVPAFFALLAPAGTPDSVIAKLDEALRVALDNPTTQQVLGNTGNAIRYTGPDGLRQYLVNEGDRWAEVITAAGIRTE